MKVSDMLVGTIDPRGDLSSVDPEAVDRHVRALKAIFDADRDEYEIAGDLRAYVALHLRGEPEVYIAVNDKLATDKVISKLNFKNYLSLVLEV